MNIIAVIALLTGAAVGGIVWFGWGLTQSLFGASASSAADAAETPAEGASEKTK